MGTGGWKVLEYATCACVGKVLIGKICFLTVQKIKHFFQLFVLVVWWHIDDGDCLEWCASKAIYVFLFPT